jgi:hypothetical protein
MGVVLVALAAVLDIDTPLLRPEPPAVDLLELLAEQRSDEGSGSERRVRRESWRPLGAV